MERVFIRNSERSTFNQCRQKWYWAYQDRYKPHSGGMNALVFGDIIHRALAEWYIPEKDIKKVVRGTHPAKAVDEIFKSIERQGRDSKIRSYDYDDEDKWVDAHELGVTMMENYVKEYGNDDEIMVVYPEMPFQYDIWDGDDYLVTFVGTTDALVKSRSTGKFGLLEHKTAASINMEHLFLDEQANTYWTVLPLWLWENGIISEDEDLEFMLYNYMRKSKGDSRPQNEHGQYLNANGSVSKRQPPPLFERMNVRRGTYERDKSYERLTLVSRMIIDAKNGKEPIYKAPSKDCSYCEFRDLCEMDEIGNDVEDYVRSAFTTWHPYEAHVWALGENPTVSGKVTNPK